MNEFECSKCGICCKLLDKSPLYQNLHFGNGVCKFLNQDTNLCTIYESRPVLCNVNKVYELYFKEEMPLEDFYLLNNSYCNELKEKFLN